MREPSWDEFQDFWNSCSEDQRLSYISRAFECDKEHKIAIAIAECLWDQIPDFFQMELEKGELGIELLEYLDGDY